MSSGDPFQSAMNDAVQELMKALETGMYYPPATPANISKEKLQNMTLTMLGWTKDPSGWHWSKTNAEGVKEKLPAYKVAGDLIVESLDDILKHVKFP